MVHKSNTLYYFFRNKLKKIKFLESILKFLLIRKRYYDAKKLLRDSNYYPNSCLDILNDYKYSIKYTNRGLFQVLNIEMS